MLLFEGQKAPVTQSKRRGFGLAVHIPVLKEKNRGGTVGLHMVPKEPSQPAKKGKHGSLSVRAAGWRGPPRQGCSHVSLAAPGACAGGSDCRFSSSPIPCVGHICEQQHIWVHSQPARPLLPREANQMKLGATTAGERAGTGHPTSVAELVEDHGHFLC